jgi:glucose-6-phosphate isomerase
MSLAAARALAAHGARLAGTTLAGLLADDPARATDFVARLGPLSLHYPRQHLDRAAREALLGLAREADLAGAFRRLVDGEIVNATEGRPALHTALRSDVGTGARARALRAEALAARERMRALGAALRAGPVTDVVHVGIGGSDLGPRLVVDALAHVADGRFRAHFLSNVDGHAVARLLGSLDPARTAAVLVSKSFTTQETLLNGRAVADWLGDRARLHAVSASPARAVAFGVPEAHVLPMWDAIGGRFSLWSAVGFTIALALGDAVFDELLAGAAELDAHALAAPCADNLPVLHGLIAHWNRRVLGRPTVAVLPYDQRLALLPAYLQQLMMESLGKSVRADGSPVDGPTAPVVWGGVGSDVQHSFFQMLHQGTDVVPCEFIGVLRPDHGHGAHHRALLANLLAQSEALARGADAEDPARRYPGDRPSSLLLLDALTPRALGMLLALYEHSCYVQAVLWDLDAFDQWGVELGKQVAGTLLPALDDPVAAAAHADPVTRALLAEYRARR